MADYSIFPIHFPAGVPHGHPHDINNAGQIAGEALAVLVDAQNNSYLPRAFLWNQGAVSILEALSDDDGSGAMALNASAELVGYSSGRAVRWSNGAIADLHPGLQRLGFSRSVANDINDAGIIVGDGRFGPDSGPLTPKSKQVWVIESGKARNLSAELGQDLYWAHAINNQGQITGGMYDASGNLRAYVYALAANQLTVLDSPTHAFGRDINEVGVVVGEVGNQAGMGQGGSMVSIGSLEAGQSAAAYGVNQDGQSVGYSHVSANQNLAAFVYDAGAMAKLDAIASPAGWKLNGARAINASRWMVAGGFDPRGDYRAVIVTPEGVIPPGGITWPSVDIDHLARAVLLILFGITQDGGGVYIGADGKLHHVGPGPGDPPPYWQQLTTDQRDLLVAAAVNRLSATITDQAGRRDLTAAASKLIGALTSRVASATIPSATALARPQPHAATPTRGRFDPGRRATGPG